MSLDSLKSAPFEILGFTMILGVVYWQWHLVNQLAAQYVSSEASAWIGILSILAILAVMRVNGTIAVWLLYLAGSVDRLFFADNFYFINPTLGIIALLISSIALVGLLAEHWKKANQLLLYLIILPVLPFMFASGVIGSLFVALRILPPNFKEKFKR